MKKLVKANGYAYDYDVFMNEVEEILVNETTTVSNIDECIDDIRTAFEEYLDDNFSPSDIYFMDDNERADVVRDFIDVCLTYLDSSEYEELEYVEE